MKTTPICHGRTFQLALPLFLLCQILLLANVRNAHSPAPLGSSSLAGANPRRMVFSVIVRGSTNCSRESGPPALLIMHQHPDPM